MSARRGRGDAAGDEEAGVELKLGEFQNVTTLTLSEARLIIDAIVEHRKKHKIALNETETLTKMRAYLDVFSRFKDREDCDSIDNLLRTRNDLAGFERSQLGASSPSPAPILALTCNQALFVARRPTRPRPSSLRFRTRSPTRTSSSCSPKLAACAISPSNLLGPALVESGMSRPGGYVHVGVPSAALRTAICGGALLF